MQSSLRNSSPVRRRSVTPIASARSRTDVDMGRRTADDRLYYKRLPSRPTESESKTSIAEDYKAYLQYYSTESLPIGFPFKCWKLKTLLITFFSLLILFFIYARYKARYKLELEERIAMKTLGGILNCDPEVMKPSSSVPADVNKVRPADIKAIAAMGDSITVASLSKNYEDEREWEIYPGNSYAMGGDGPLKQQISTGKILREFNSKLVGLSHGKGYDDTVFNVAVGGMTSEDLPRQARELISRMKSKKISLTEDWKLVSMFIGTNDVGKLNCYSERDPIDRKDYKANINEAISILRESTNRTIVSIISMWNSQLAMEARSIIEEGKRVQCSDHYMEKRDALCTEYRKVAYEIQNERHFDSKDFTVVVQGFMDEIYDAFRNKSGEYDKSFYADDVFHLSKYGNAVVGKFLWNSMLEPVGSKSKKVNLGDDSAPIRCPTKERPYVQTLGNR